MAVNPTTIGPLLKKIKARLVEKLGFPSNRVLIVARRITSHPSASQVVTVRPMKPTPGKEIGFSAAGRANPVVKRGIAVSVITRLSLDKVGEDEQFLEHESLGHFQVEDKILDALIDWLPTTTNPEADPGEEEEGMTTSPIKWEDGQQPEKDEKIPEWGESVLYFTVTFQQDLDQDTL